MQCRTLGTLLGILALALVKAIPTVPEPSITAAPLDDSPDDDDDEGPYTYCTTCPLLGTEHIVQILPTVTPGVDGYVSQTIPADKRKFKTLGPEAWKHRPKFDRRPNKNKKPQATEKPKAEGKGKDQSVKQEG